MTITQTVPRLSWSQVSTYTQCPAKWWLSRHFAPEHTASALKFGSAIHRAVASFYTARAEGCSLEAGELLNVYQAAWSEPEVAEVKFGKNEDDATLRAMAERMLGCFVDTVQPGEVLLVEGSFATEIVEGVLVSGVVDLVEVRDGIVRVVDVKTSRQQPSSAFSGEQLGIYRLGLAELGLVPHDAEFALEYLVLRKLRSKAECVVVPGQFTEEEFDRLRQKIAQVARAIQLDVVYRVRSWACASCPWIGACSRVDLAAGTAPEVGL